MSKQTTKLEIDKISPDEILEIIAERMGNEPVYKAKIAWKAVISTIRDSLLSGKNVTLPKIGIIELRKSRSMVRQGKVVGGNIVAKMKFNPVFRTALRNGAKEIIEDNGGDN